jgi:transposase
MATMGRPKAELTLTDDEREVLRGMLRRRTTAQSLALRARIVLRCEQADSNRDLAEEVGVSEQTVGKWRRRFLARRVDGLYDEPRIGGPRTISDARVEDVVHRTLTTKPKSATHWTTRQLARTVGLSPASVGRIWKAFGLQPHRAESFSLSKDPQFVAKVRDIVGLYLDPPERALVLCVDEKSQIQALDRAQPALPIMFEHPERRTHSYVRHGTTSLFAALDIATGNVIGKCFRKHRGQEFLAFLDLIERSVPANLDVHLVMDNYATHKTPRVKRWLLRHPRFHVHFTPTSSSWLNLVECFFSILSRRLLKRGVHRSTLALEKDIRRYLDSHNDEPRPFVWTKSADQILAQLERYCSAVNASQTSVANS